MLESNNPKQKFLKGVVFKLLMYRWDSGEWMWYFRGSRNLTFTVYSYTQCFLGMSSQALWAMLEVKTILNTWIPKSTWQMQLLVVLHSIYITALFFSESFPYGKVLLEKKTTIWNTGLRWPHLPPRKYKSPPDLKLPILSQEISTEKSAYS